jgi:transposase-like protein
VALGEDSSGLTHHPDKGRRATLTSGISKSQVSRLCAELDEQRVGAFLSRPFEGEWPYLWLDATYVRVRQAVRIVLPPDGVG